MKIRITAVRKGMTLPEYVGAIKKVTGAKMVVIKLDFLDHLPQEVQLFLTSRDLRSLAELGVTAEQV